MLSAWRDRSAPELTVAVSFGLVFSQMGLLGIWGGLGTSSWWRRLLSGIAGIGYLGLLTRFGVSEPGSEVVLLVGTVLVAGVLLLARCFRLRIGIVGADQAAPPRMQFSIRQLLFLTFVVACIVSLGKYLEPNLTLGSQPAILPLVGLLAATVGLLSVWPVLGARSPAFPILIMFAAATGLGAGFGRLCPPYGKPAYFWLWMVITFVEALSLVASLLVIRSGGYRLVRLPSRRTVVESVAS